MDFPVPFLITATFSPRGDFGCRLPRRGDGSQVRYSPIEIASIFGSDDLMICAIVYLVCCVFTLFILQRFFSLSVSELHGSLKICS